MSKIVEYRSLGLKWPIAVPSTLAELVAAAGGEDKVLAIATDHIVYHNTLSGVRSDFVDALAQATGIAVKTKVVKPEVKDAAGNITQEEVTAPAESEGEFVDRVCAQLNVEVDSFAHLQQPVIEKNPFSAATKERKAPTPKTPTKADYATADAVINAGADKAAQVAALLASKVSHEVAADRESLARAIMENRKAEEAKLAATLSAGLLS